MSEKVTPEWLFKGFVDGCKKRGLDWTTGDWTNVLFEVMGELAGLAGGYHPSDSKRKERWRREWLVDHCWASKEDYQDYSGLFLACESELKPHPKVILDDAMKLGDIKADYKVLICTPPRCYVTRSDNRFKELIGAFHAFTRRHVHASDTEHYLVFAMTWTREGSDVTYHGFHWRTCDDSIADLSC